MKVDTTGKLLVVLGTVVSMFALTLGAIVALTIAGRPVSSVIWISGSMTAPTVLSLLTLIGVGKIRYDIHNGVQDSIAAKTAEIVKNDAVLVAKTKDQ